MQSATPSKLKAILSVSIAFIFTFVVGFIVYRLYFLGAQVHTLETNYGSLTTDKDTLEQAYDTLLYEDHLSYLQRHAIEQSKSTIEQEYEKFKSEAEGERLAQIESVYSAYQDVVTLLERNSSSSLDTTGVNDKLDNWGTKFLNQEFDSLNQELATAKKDLEDQYTQYLASIPTPTPTSIPPTSAPPAPAAAGYSYQTVATSRGTFGVYLIKMNLSGVTIKTVGGNTNDCDNNCTAKPLAQYVSENGAYAGMHGTYFCPPDYAQCAGKTYSYDYPLFDSNTKTWRNQAALKWNNLGLMTFNGKSLGYAGANKSYPGSGLTAGISNFPMLVQNGDIVVDSYSLDSYQATAKGARGAIGTDNNNVYLAIASGATVPDMAYIMKALGATNALNLDGGGSSAMYIGGSYKVGPGRALPNAIVLVKN